MSPLRPWLSSPCAGLCSALAFVAVVHFSSGAALAQGADGLAPPPAPEAPSTPSPPDEVDTPGAPADEVDRPPDVAAPRDIFLPDPLPGPETETPAQVVDPHAAALADEVVSRANADSTGPRLHALVIDAAPYGVDPVVGEHVSVQLRQTAEEMGYEVASRDQSVEAARRISMPFPPAPADLWRVTWAGQAQRGIFARVWAQDGRYVIEIMVASMDGSGPFFARGTSGAQDLHSVVDTLLRQALPTPDRWDAQAAERYMSGEPAIAGATPAVMAPAGTPTVFAPVVTGGSDFHPRRRSHRPTRRFDLALSTEAAIGTGRDRFYNHLIGARLDLRITTEIMLGAYAGYANLRGRDGRAQNMLFYLQAEDRIRLGESTDWTIPLRFALGYLPFNGPFVRISAGLNVPVSERVELGIDLLAPTFWVIPGGVAVSLDVGLEVIYRL